mgnify:FL=1
MTSYKTADGLHGANIMQNGDGGSYMAFATQDNGNGGMEYWYTIGSYKAESTATKYAARSLAQHGYTIKA